MSQTTRLQSHAVSYFWSCSIWMLYCLSVCQRYVKVPGRRGKIDASDSDCEHEGLVRRAGKGSEGRVIVVGDGQLGENDVIVEGVEGEIGEHANEEGDPDDGDDSSSESGVALSMTIALEGAVCEKIALEDKSFDVFHSII